MTKYYRNCDELPMYNFSKILETNNYAYLVVGYDGYEDAVFEESKANEFWESIYEEYCKLTQDNKSLMYFAIFQELVYLKTRYQVAVTLLTQLELGLSDDLKNDFIEELRKWKYKINKDRPLKDELGRMLKQLNASTNAIKIKQSQLDDLKAKNSEKLSLIEQTVKLELALGKNEIDIKKTVVAKFVALFKEVQLLNQARKKRNGK